MTLEFQRKNSGSAEVDRDAKRLNIDVMISSRIAFISSVIVIVAIRVYYRAKRRLVAKLRAEDFKVAETHRSDIGCCLRKKRKEVCRELGSNQRLYPPPSSMNHLL
jgi:hypothetical protein